MTYPPISASDLVSLFKEHEKELVLTHPEPVTYRVAGIRCYVQQCFVLDAGGKVRRVYISQNTERVL